MLFVINVPGTFRFIYLFIYLLVQLLFFLFCSVGELNPSNNKCHEASRQFMLHYYKIHGTILSQKKEQIHSRLKKRCKRTSPVNNGCCKQKTNVFKQKSKLRAHL